jgi:hypothetical protein
MPLDNFLELQTELFWAFGWMIRWWFVFLAVAGLALAAFMFFLQVVSTWLEAR